MNQSCMRVIRIWTTEVLSNRIGTCLERPTDYVLVFVTQGLLILAVPEVCLIRLLVDDMMNDL